MLEVVPYFAVPLGFVKLENCDALNRQLRELFQRREADGSVHANPNPLTQRNRRLSKANFKAGSLRAAAQGVLLEPDDADDGQLNGYDMAALERMLISSNSWFHLLGAVDSVDPGKHDPDKQGERLLSFVNPSVTAATYMDAANLNLQGAFAYRIRHVQLEPRRLVLWILHDVKPFGGGGEGITVAFNCCFAFQDAAAPASA